jgi:hypothetical protein
MLARYREAVDDEKRGRALERAIEKVEQAGAVVGGSALVRVPKPYDAEHPRGALLKHKGLHAGIDGPHPKELSDARLVDVALERAARLQPLHAWIMEQLVR